MAGSIVKQPPPTKRNQIMTLKDVAAKSVVSFCPVWAPLPYTKGFTLGKNPTSVKNVEDASLKAQHFLDI